MSGDPVAFLSYAHHDDRRGYLTRLRQYVEEELHSQTGEPFEIFMDSDHIGLGERWRRRLDKGLAAATFLIPVLSPSFLKSEYCRDELMTFGDHGSALGRDDLVLPIYYIDCSDVATDEDEASAEALEFILEHQYFDWRELRALPMSNNRVRRALTELAGEIRAARKRTRGDIEEAKLGARSDPSRGRASISKPSIDDSRPEETVESESKVTISTEWERRSGFPVSDHWPKGKVELVVTTQRLLVRSSSGVERDVALDEITITAVMGDRIEVYPRDQSKTFRIVGLPPNRLYAIEHAIADTPGGWRNPTGRR